MSLRWLFGCVILWLFFSLFLMNGEGIGAQNWCDDAQKDLEQEQLRLEDYLSALHESYDKKDFKLMEALNFKINQTKQRVHELELIIEHCTSQETNPQSGGLSPAKSHDGPFVHKSCADLKKMVFPLLVSKRALERREKSMVSQLTDEEEAKLLEVSEQLRNVRKELKTRCSTAKSSRSLLKRLRR